MDLGPLNDVVSISFLNFSLGVFGLCVLLMVVVSKGSAVKQGVEELTMEFSALRGTRMEVMATVAILVAVGGLWVHFS